MTIDELLITLGLDAKGVDKGMKEAESRISKGVSMMTAKLGALGAALGAAFSFQMAFNQYAQEADALGKMARSLEMNVADLHAWSDATARAGGSAEAFQGTIRQLSAQLGRIGATGTGRVKTMLEGLGIDAGELGRTRKSIDVLLDLSERMQTMSKAEQFSAAQALGLDIGTTNLLAEGPQKIKDILHAQKELGAVTERDVYLTETFNDGIEDLGKSFRYTTAIVFRMVLPAVNKLIEWGKNFFSFLQKHERFVQAFFIGLAAVVTTVALPALAKLTAAFIFNPITLMVAALAALALAFEDLLVYAEGGEVAFGDFWEAIFGSPEEAAATLEEVKNGFSALVDFIKDLGPVVAEIFSSQWPGALGIFEVAMKHIVSWGKEKTAELENAFISFAEKIKQVIGAAFDWIWSKFTGIFDPMIAKLQAFADKGRGIIGDISPFSMPEISATDTVPASSFNGGNNSYESNVNTGDIHIHAENGYDAADQFVSGLESHSAGWANQANYSVG